MRDMIWVILKVFFISNYEKWKFSVWKFENTIRSKLIQLIIDRK